MKIKPPSTRTRIELEPWEVEQLIKAADEVSQAYHAKPWEPISGNTLTLLLKLAKALKS